MNKIISVLLLLAFQQSGGFFGSHGAPSTTTAPTSCTTTNTIAYYDPDNITSCTGGTFTGLNDSSSTHANLVPANGPTCLAAVLNGHNVMALDSASSQYFTTTADIPDTTGVITVYVIFKPTVSGAKMSFTSSGTGGKSLVYAINPSNLQTIEQQGTAVLGTSTTAVSASWFLGTGSWNGSTTTSFYLNATADGTGTGTLSGGLTTINAIGSNFSSGSPIEFVDGQIGLLVITSAAPDATFQSCLVSKYAL